MSNINSILDAITPFKAIIMKRTYKTQSLPNIWQRIQWYNRKFWPWILFNLSLTLVAAIFISAFVSGIWVLVFTLAVFIIGYMNAHGGKYYTGDDHMIYEVTIDDERKEVTVKYCMLLKSKTVLPFEKIHVNVAMYTRKKGVRKQSHLFIFRKTFFKKYCLGSVKYPCSAFPWKKEDIYNLSQDLFEIKLKNKTWRPDDIMYASPSGTPMQGKWAFKYNNLDEIG